MSTNTTLEFIDPSKPLIVSISGSNWMTPVGWECPRCHAVNAPHVNQCNCRPGVVTAGTRLICNWCGQPCDHLERRRVDGNDLWVCPICMEKE